jgi:DNA-binding PadR family transcriptional regulator
LREVNMSVARPLKPPYFHILLALASRDLHGYGIQRAVLDQTDDQIRLWPAMLYRSLGKLERAELIRSAQPPEGEPEDERRQYYAITSRGRERLREEAEMLARWARAAEHVGS